MSTALYQTNQGIPQDMLLGNLLFVNLIDMKVADSDLSAIFKKNNIPESYIKSISAADAFRRASSSVKNRIIYVTDAAGMAQKVHVNVDEVRCDSDGIKRIIGVKKIDEVNEDIQYESVAEVIFKRDTDTCVTMKITQDADVADICQEIEDKYADWSVYHNKDTVRNIINRIISDTHPVNLMPTGLCKFIPQASTDLLYNLKEALKELSFHRVNVANGDNIMEIIPVIDTEEQRELVEKNFTAEITDELFNFTQELKEVLTKRTILSVRTATSYIDKFNLLKEKAKEYESLLGIYVDSIHQQITASLELVDANTDTDDSN